MDIRHSPSSTKENPDINVLRLSPEEATVALAGLEGIYKSKVDEGHPVRSIINSLSLRAPYPINNYFAKMNDRSIRRQVSNDPELLVNYRLEFSRGGLEAREVVLTANEANVAVSAIYRMATEGNSSYSFAVFEQAERLKDELDNSFPEVPQPTDQV